MKPKHVMRLDQGFEMKDGNDDDCLSSTSRDSDMRRLRLVTMNDFNKVIHKLIQSFSDKGKELMRVWDWND